MTAIVATSHASLPQLIKQAAAALAAATTAGEVLDARDKASVAYDAAKKTARILKARAAHDEVIAATHRAQADALEIEAAAKRRLADEYDGAQKRGEVSAKGQHRAHVPDGNMRASAGDVGLTAKQVFEAREIRDAIERDPGVVGRVLGELLEQGAEPTRAALKRAIAPAVKSIRADDQAEKKVRRGAREIELGARQTALPTGKKYGLIVADPEWKFQPYSDETGMDRAADNHYPTSDYATIQRRDVGAIAARDCVLLLWATVPMLVEAICVADAWGFCSLDRVDGYLTPDKAHCRYVSHWAWLKQKIAPGYWTRGKHEVLLIFTRGKPVAPAMGDQLASWLDAEMAVEADAGEHSAKPEVFLEWVDKLWPNTPKIELNRRGPARAGWDAWGFEADLPIEPVAQPAKAKSALPPPPGKRAPIELSVGGMKKGSHANFGVRLNADGKTFGVSGSFQFKGWLGGGGPFEGAHATFPEALRAGLDLVGKACSSALQSADPLCTDSHRAAARAALRWIEARAAEWGVPA